MRIPFQSLFWPSYYFIYFQKSFFSNDFFLKLGFRVHFCLLSRIFVFIKPNLVFYNPFFCNLQFFSSLLFFFFCTKTFLVTDQQIPSLFTYLTHPSSSWERFAFTNPQTSFYIIIIHHTYIVPIKTWSSTSFEISW